MRTQQNQQQIYPLKRLQQMLKSTPCGIRSVIVFMMAGKCLFPLECSTSNHLVENGRRTLTTSYRTTDSSMDPSLTTPSSAKLLSNMSTGTSAQPSGVRKSNMNYTTRKQLVYRQPNHSMLSRRTERQPRPSEILPVRREKNRLLSDIQPSSKEPAKSGGTSNG